MKKIVTWYFTAVTALFMTSIFLRFFTLNVLIENLHIDNAFTRIVFFDKPLLTTEANNIDWAALYPFQDNDDIIKKTNRLDNFKNTIFIAEEKIESYTKDNLINRINFVESAVKYENIIGWKLHETVYDLGDGWLTELVEKTEIIPGQQEQNSGNITTPAAALYEFTDFLAKLDIDFLYVQSPHKIGKEDTITGASDFSNENADELLNALSLKHIPYLDLRDNIRQENLNHHSLFYKTDHHWKAETGLWAAGIIARYLNDNNGFNINPDVFAPDQYRYDVYEARFLGSIGKKVTLVYAPPEDISLIYPQFTTGTQYNTNFSLKIPSKNIDAEGGFDIFYDYSRIKETDYYNLSPYGAYLYGDNPLVIIHNKTLSDNKRILVIKDSFVNCVVPFLSLGLENIEVLDLRHFTGSVKTYIKQNKPDMVIVMHIPGVIKSPDYGTHISLFDFR